MPRRSLCIILLLGMGCAQQPPLVIVASIDGPEAWARHYLVGDGQFWRLLPHSDRVEDLFAGIHEGFPAPWAYGPVGNLRGQGSLLTLASREGWATAVFAAPSKEMRPLVAHLASCAATAALYPCDRDTWPSLRTDLDLWAACNHVPRLAVVHVSLDGHPQGQAGAQSLVHLWMMLDERIHHEGPGSAVIGVYLPNPAALRSVSLFRVVGHISGRLPPRDILLSTLDVAPTIAAALNLHYTPDYPGQSLAALHEAGRTEPIPLVRGSTAMVMGNRWMAWAEPFEDKALPSNIRFFDLWAERFTGAGMADGAALALLDSLPHRPEPIPQDLQYPIPQTQPSLQ